MKKSIFAILFILFIAGLIPEFAAGQPEEKITKKPENSVSSVVLSTFKKHHLLFLEELSSPTELTAATARPDDAIFKDGKVVHDHDHSAEEGENEEHLNIIVFKATPDADGNYHTPTVKLGNRIYTYKEIYTVSISDKSVSVRLTRAVKNSPTRADAEPDPNFMSNLAFRLSGKLASFGNIIILP